MSKTSAVLVGFLYGLIAAVFTFRASGFMPAAPVVPPPDALTPCAAYVRAANMSAEVPLPFTYVDDYEAALASEPELFRAPQRKAFVDDASYHAAYEKYLAFGNWATMPGDYVPEVKP